MAEKAAANIEWRLENTVLRYAVFNNSLGNRTNNSMILKGVGGLGVNGEINYDL